MKEFVYHMVPNELVGDKLIPLNSLKTSFPNLYEKYTIKYLNHPERIKLLERKIPKLNCLWNDVIHFLPIHPSHVYNALTTLEIKTKEEVQFYKVPIGKLANNKNALYLYSKERYRGPAEDIVEDEIKLLNVSTFKELNELPSETLDYYKTEKEKGNKFGLFPFIPHVLSLGQLEVKNIEIINWNQPI